MFNPTTSEETGAKFYELLVKQAEQLLMDEKDAIANLANISSLLFMMMHDVNWAGFYLWKEDQLILGPFQGKPACVRIAKGKGVCGTAVSEQRSLVVEDVYQFPGHIFCDGDSRSEVVIPIMVDGRVIGVLDVDSPLLGRFNDVDREGLESIVQVLLASTDLSQW
ncbi:MAG: GAF domain-containing protein [Acidibacillus sp.]|uniref:Free methionine-R-sulfoxide reductase n=1 Tax=Sulfoacidibacillus ferrooxidans TaxID=2005001 RepID=A0A9X2ABG3_9BACL|nr:GAF domain-containing protein [Sulfoacidibacillus ferrooxidans]MCI0182963.1 Free methionine-R-sulfoxide reductase [Sulfoacidibacillus ferrooxidans]MCY0893465.1 GAF domain-containing protein [Acidibacillus sp.]